ncbi:MAG: bifunctional heptose 7-phosphate kinase/heptose 1-phosphate adenyltransferase [Phycisphaerae bacterium]|nr:bifunctional heptose 7-phosphate kinase/heptose 1-phosphate adenyltransferase [Phycisphaerae bacterium]
MYEHLLKVVNHLGSPRILVVGDTMLDAYVYGDVRRISPEGPVPVLQTGQTHHRCGGAASVALDLAALGAGPVCLGVIGDDQEGRILKDLLDQAGADTAGLLISRDRPTTTKTRLMGLCPSRDPQLILRMDRESAVPLPDALGRTLLDLYRRGLEAAEAVCLQDHNKGILTAPVCQELIRLARQARKPVLVDPALGVDYCATYRGASLITPNRQEAAAAVGFEVSRAPDFAKAADRLYQDLGLDAVVITLDQDGVYLKTADTGRWVRALRREVRDSTGAGDMVLATLAVALAAGCDYPTAVLLSNIAAGIEVEKSGAAPVSIEEIVRDLRTQTGCGQGKIRTLEALLPDLDRHRRRKATIVFTNGCFDVVHRGHVECLRFCRAQGDVVVVGLNSDASVRAIKGPGRPIHVQDDRTQVLAALESVDYVTVFDELDPLALIRKIRPDVLVKGMDWKHKGVVGADVVRGYGGKVVLAPLVEGRSSTATIQRMQAGPTREGQDSGQSDPLSARC